MAEGTGYGTFQDSPILANLSGYAFGSPVWVSCGKLFEMQGFAFFMVRSVPFVVACSVLLAFAPAGFGQAGLIPLEQDDAGSGSDAPDTLEAAQSAPYTTAGVVHKGYVDPTPTVDKADFFRVAGLSGDILHVDSFGNVGCLQVYGADGTRLDIACPTIDWVRMQAWVQFPSDEDLFIGIVPYAGGPYAFSFDINQFAPEADFDGVGLPIHDDADSGHDAPDIPGPHLPVSDGDVVDGSGRLFHGDIRDFYLINAPADSTVRVKVLVGTGSCVAIVQTSDEMTHCALLLDNEPFAVLERTLDGAGPYYVGINNLDGGYAFEFDLLPGP